MNRDINNICLTKGIQKPIKEETKLNMDREKKSLYNKLLQGIFTEINMLWQKYFRF
jgi:hypothetical protein